MDSRLRELRKKKGITQMRIQMEIGIDQSDYSKIERGERYMSLEQCRRLALLLGTSMDYLVGLTDNPEPYARSKQYQNERPPFRAVIFYLLCAGGWT